jgi:hypothetical protein
MSFDMRKNLSRAPEVPVRVSMERVRQVAAEQRLFPKVRKLADPVRPAENAHIRVYSHHDHVRNATLFEKTEDFLAVIAYGVLWSNLYRRNLSRPWVGGAALTARLG